jgi:hypothetical protein
MALSEKGAGILLSMFQDMYKQELGAEEDVHRTLPFFATALGLIVTALVFAHESFALVGPRYGGLPGLDNHRPVVRVPIGQLLSRQRF